MRISFKQMMVAELVAIVLVSCACYALHLRLVTVAEAQTTQPTNQEVQLVGELPKFPEPVVKTPAQRKSNWFRANVYAEYSKYYNYKTGVKYLARIQKYQPIIDQAAKAYGLDSDVLTGVIAVESTGLENSTSTESAKGLMQILQAPHQCEADVKKKLGVSLLQMYDPRQNIFLGACTLAEYAQGKNDLLLGLVAYNYGPNRQSVQKAKTLYSLEVASEIKAYPIKVYSLILMAKIKRQHQEVLAYNEANRSRFDSIDFPGTTD